MPMYRYLCGKCGEEREEYGTPDDARKACVCGGVLERQIPRRIHTNCNRLDFVTADITGEPVRIQTQRQLSNLCDANGVRRVASDEIRTSRKAKDTYSDLDIEPFGRSVQKVMEKTGLSWQEPSRKGKKKRRAVAA